ncbi:MAG: carbohydrate binding family 9 domain-containing protein, partial [Candidatus Aminicenantales bacterium]
MHHKNTQIQTGLVVLFLLLAPLAFSVQETPAAKPAVVAAPPIPLTKASSPIVIDGVLDDPAWEQAARLGIAFEWTPGENVPPPVKSEVLVSFDESAVYIGFRCFDPEPGAIRAHLMDRDDTDTLIQDDHISFMIDTFNDERRAFQFRVNPLGVQADAAFSEQDGSEDFSWDAIWKSAGRIEEFGYAIEVAIPFNQIRFPSGGGIQTWGFEADRSYPRNVRHRMSTHPRDRNRMCLICQFNKISGFEGISPGINLQLTPTLTVNRTDTRPDFPEGGMT